MITAGMVKELREKTGAGMMDCKKALSEANGDMEKALIVLREKGMSTAAKKAERITAEGLIAAFISEDKKSGAIVEVNCETDFVAANKEFIGLADSIAEQAANTNAENIEGFMKEKYIKDGSITVKDAVTNLIAKLGENMCIKRFKRFSIDDGMVYGYIHNMGRIGVLIKLCCSRIDEAVEEVGKEIAMQVAAANPSFLDIEEIDEGTLEEVKQKFRSEAQVKGKTQNIIDKIVSGKLNKYYKESCLLQQPWIKDEDAAIAAYLKEASGRIGADIKVEGFARFERGQDAEVS